MTERQMRAEVERERYNAALRTKVVKYRGCEIRYVNPAGFGFFAVKTPFDSFLNGDQFKTITKAKEAIKRVCDKREAQA